MMMNSPNKQRGAVLVTALIFLVMMTIFAVTALRSSTLEERAAANYQFRTVADQTAETAIGTVLSKYTEEQSSGVENHIFKQAFDASDHKLFYPNSSGATQSLDALLGGNSGLHQNADSDYRSLIEMEEEKYQRAGDDSNHRSMLFSIEGEGDLGDTGAKSKHRELVSIPLANVNGYTRGYTND